MRLKQEHTKGNHPGAERIRWRPDQQYRRRDPVFEKHPNLRIEIKRLRHDEMLELPETALREAIVDTVCRRDYFEKGANVMVKNYDDQLENNKSWQFAQGVKSKRLW
ncbi:hypothetical protein KKA14_12640 [bacterium]|nr:hypothetical protein [bacterium]